MSIFIAYESSNLDFIRGLVPTNLPEQLKTLSESNKKGREIALRLNETLTDINAKAASFASHDHLADLKEKYNRHEKLVDELRNSINGLSLNVNDELLKINGNVSGVVEQRHQDLLKRVESREDALTKELKAKASEIDEYKNELKNTRQLVTQLAGELSNINSLTADKINQLENRQGDGSKRVEKFDQRIRQLRVELLSTIGNTDAKFSDYLRKDDLTSVMERLKALDAGTKKIEAELATLEQTKHKVQHNEEIARQQFELLKTSLDKQSEQFGIQLGQQESDTSQIKEMLQNEVQLLNDRIDDIGVNAVDLLLLQNSIEQLDGEVETLFTRVEEVESSDDVNTKISTLQNKLTDLAKEVAKTQKLLAEKDSLTEELFGDLTTLSEKGTNNQRLIDDLDERVNSKEEVIQYLTSQNSVLANKVNNNQQQISRVKHLFNSTVNNLLKDTSANEKIPDNLMLRLQSTYATKDELEQAIEQQGQNVQLISDLTEKTETEFRAIGSRMSKITGKISDVDSKAEMNKMELENFLVDKELMQKSIVRTNQMANANHNQIILISTEMEKLDAALEDTKVKLYFVYHAYS